MSKSMNKSLPDPTLAGMRATTSTAPCDFCQ
jgi:hypothetical protein